MCVVHNSCEKRNPFVIKLSNMPSEFNESTVDEEVSKIIGGDKQDNTIGLNFEVSDTTTRGNG